MTRGYACIALHMPKTTINVGSAMRAAFVYDARLIVTSGQRYSPVAADTMKAYRHIPFLQAADVFDVIPYDCVPVAVDLVAGACALPDYRHPERAFYVFGPEDGTLGAKVLDRCRDRVMVPTRMCMNLAATVNVILYDRLAKRSRGPMVTTSDFDSENSRSNRDGTATPLHASEDGARHG